MDSKLFVAGLAVGDLTRLTSVSISAKITFLIIGENITGPQAIYCLIFPTEPVIETVKWI